MESDGKINASSRRLNESSRNGELQLDIHIFEFLNENKYVIVNDNVYVSLDALIDDNPDFFRYKFKHVVKKSLGLIYYTDDLNSVSSTKRQLKEQLLDAFTGTQSLISTLTADYHLLLKLYSAFYKLRIKLFVKEGDSIRSHIYGDKSVTASVRILCDSVMFYLLMKRSNQNSKVLESSYRSSSPIAKNSFAQSESSCTTLQLISANLSPNKIIQQETNSLQSKKSLRISRNKSDNNLMDSHFSIGHRQRSKKDLKNSDDSFAGKPRYEGRMQSRNFHGDSINVRNVKWVTWKNLNEVLIPNTDQKITKDLSDDIKSARFTKMKSGTLESYSASRQCGFIVADDELELIVVRDELLEAGVPAQLLEASASRINKKLKFVIRKLAVEPVATFEAVEIRFSNLHCH
jgi:hypothetical protein